MNKHLAYGLFYILLLPMALLLGLSVLFGLLSAFANPVLLLPFFILACFVVYTIASFVFYIKAVRQQQVCKPSLRDLIRINAFIIMLPALYFILQGVLVFANPGIVKDVIVQLKAMQQPMPALPDATLARLLLSVYYFFVAYAIAVMIHVVYTFRLLKQYKLFFVAP